mgnify:CR=1 FL=1
MVVYIKHMGYAPTHPSCGPPKANNGELELMDSIGKGEARKIPFDDTNTEEGSDPLWIPSRIQTLTVRIMRHLIFPIEDQIYPLLFGTLSSQTDATTTPISSKTNRSQPEGDPIGCIPQAEAYRSCSNLKTFPWVGVAVILLDTLYYLLCTIPTTVMSLFSFSASAGSE